MTNSVPLVSQVKSSSEPMTYRQLTLMFLTVHIFLWGLFTFAMFLKPDETMFIITASLTVAAVLASLIVFMLPKRILSDPIPQTLDRMLHFPN